MQPPQHLGLWPGLTLSNTAKACLIGQLLSLLLAVMGEYSGITEAACDPHHIAPNAIR